MTSNLTTSRHKTRSPARLAKALPPVTPPVRLKTIVRRLPPNLPEPIFWQSVQPWVSDETASWKVFYPGKLRKPHSRSNNHVSSRAYILFRNEEALGAFSRGYNGHMFRDKQGNESQAVVEFAPNQKVPAEKKKADARHATIQSDEDYISFLAALRNPKPKAPEVDYEALLTASQPSEEPKITPLLAALQEQKSTAQEKKILASDSAKANYRKAAATSASAAATTTTTTSPKAEGEGAAQAAAKRSRKGKSKHHASTSAASPFPSVTPQSGTDVAGVTATPSGGQPAAVLSAGGKAADTEEVPSSPKTTKAKRMRPVLGLQSRHLKAALNGAGVNMLPAAPRTPGTPAVEAAAGTSSGTAPTSQAVTGGGKQKEMEKNEKEGGGGPAKNANRGGAGGGGGRGGKERARSRHHPAGGAGPGTGRGSDLAPHPRILMRQTTAPPVGLGEAPARDESLAATTGTQERTQEMVSHRGRGKRGRT